MTKNVGVLMYVTDLHAINANSSQGTTVIGHLDERSLLHGALECSKAIDGCNNSWFRSLQKISEPLITPLESSANIY